MIQACACYPKIPVDDTAVEIGEIDSISLGCTSCGFRGCRNADDHATAEGEVRPWVRRFEVRRSLTVYSFSKVSVIVDFHNKLRSENLNGVASI